MKLQNKAPVPYAEAKARVVEYMEAHGIEDRLFMAAQLARAIWPDHQMRAQGAGGAATRILKRMEAERLVYWSAQTYGGSTFWGWRLRTK